MDRFAAHGFKRDTGAVVADIKHHVAAFVGQLKRNHPLLGLTAGMAHLGGLQTVVDGVAQHVLQRRHHALQHVAVNLGFGVDDAEFDLFAQLAGHLAHYPLEARQYALERHHAGAHQALL